MFSPRAALASALLAVLLRCGVASSSQKPASAPTAAPLASATFTLIDAGLSCAAACGAAFTDADQDGKIICSCHYSCLADQNCCLDFQNACPPEYGAAIAYYNQQVPDAPVAVHDPQGVYGACGLVSNNGLIKVPPKERYSDAKGSCKGFCDKSLTDDAGTVVCFCDVGCLMTNDCCPDYLEHCTPDACIMDSIKNAKVFPDTCAYNQCNRAVPSVVNMLGYCYCDDGCIPHHDCCPDYAKHCPVPEKYLKLRPEEKDGSCANRCFRQSGGCWCDTQCIQHGDCCKDFFSFCTVPTPMTLVIGLGSCEDNCGGSSWDCFCDKLCMLTGDCCTDFLTRCPDTKISLKSG